MRYPAKGTSRTYQARLTTQYLGSLLMKTNMDDSFLNPRASHYLNPRANTYLNP